MRILVLLLLSQSLYADEVLFSQSAKKAERAGPLLPTNLMSGSTEKPKDTRNKRKARRGNLPTQSLSDPKLKKYSGESIIRPEKPVKTYIQDLFVGQKIIAKVDEGVLGYENSKVPVSATIVHGKYSGSILYGFSEMSKVTKRILITFTSLTTLNGDTYSFKGSFKDASGLEGVEGELISNQSKSISLDLLLSFGKGFAEVAKSRSVTSWGAQVQDITVKNAYKNAISEGANSSIERIRKDVLTAKEFVVSQKGFTGFIQIIEKPYQL